jgi:TonB family protein
MSLLAVALLGIFGQGKVDEAAARALVVKQVNPVYPVRAKSAHLTGDVVVEVKVDPRGHVEWAKAVSGAPILQTPAVDAVKRWVFSPAKQDGVLTSFETRITISFPIHSAASLPAAAPVVAAAPAPAPTAEQPRKDAAAENPARTQYVELAVTCKKLVAERGDPAAQAKTCEAAARKGDELGAERDSEERRAGYVYAATALMRNQKFAEAAAYGGKAVDVVKQAREDGAGASAAYAVKGQAEAFAGDFAAADLDLREAEKFERTAAAASGGERAAAGLKQLLNLRSQVLLQLGKKDAAAKLKAEAEKP